MKAQLNMIGIITNNFQQLADFYQNVLELKVTLQLDQFIEFETGGMRLAISTNQVMADATKQESYTHEKKGHSFELAFKVNTPAEVDDTYQQLTAKGATPIKAPETMPWNQRTAFFADPDGNIHEIFADLDS